MCDLNNLIRNNNIEIMFFPSSIRQKKYFFLRHNDSTTNSFDSNIEMVYTVLHTNSAITNKKTYHKDDIDWSEFGSHWLSIARQFSEYNKTTFWVEHMEFVQNVTPNSHYPNRNECKQRLDTVKWVRLIADYDFKSIWFERSVWSLNHQTNWDHIFNISISNSIKKMTIVFFVFARIRKLDASDWCITFWW